MIHSTAVVRKQKRLVTARIAEELIQNILGIEMGTAMGSSVNRGLMSADVLSKVARDLQREATKRKVTVGQVIRERLAL